MQRHTAAFTIVDAASLRPPRFHPQNLNAALVAQWAFCAASTTVKAASGTVAKPMATLASPGIAAYSTADGRGTGFAAAALPPNGTAVARSTSKAQVKVH